MTRENSKVVKKGDVILLLSGVVLLVCGILLLVYAWAIRFTAIEFLEKGCKAEATIRSIERRGVRHGGRRITVGFWEKRDGSLLGELHFAELTDLVPLQDFKMDEGGQMEIRWFEEKGRLRVAPEGALHPETRPPEMRFDFGIAVAAMGGILLGLFGMREARRRERPGEMT